MATTTKKTATKKAATKRTSASTTAKKAATKKTPAVARSAAAEKAAATRKRNQAAEDRKRKAAADKAAATRKRNQAAAEREKVAPTRPPLTERDRRILAEDASYAAAGVAVDAVSVVRLATAKLDHLRIEVQKAAADPVGTVRGAAEAAPAQVTRTVDDVRGRLVAELESAIARFERTFDAKATEGRKLLESLRSDDRVAKLLDQTSTARSQVKGALTSVTRTVDVAVGAGRKQAGTAASQVKGATTSMSKTVDAAVGAGRKQAETARSQVKAAATSVTRAADAVPAAAEAAQDRVDAAS